MSAPTFSWFRAPSAGDDFGIGSTFYQAPPSTAGSNPMKWDQWSAMWQSVTGGVSMVGAVGNHEMEVSPTHFAIPVKMLLCPLSPEWVEPW